VPTLQEIADAAGVSLATASRVLNGSGERRVSDEYRARVMAAAAELNFVADASPEPGAQTRSRALVILADNIEDPSVARILTGMMHAAESRDYSLLVIPTGGRPARRIESLAVVRAMRPQALVIVGTAAEAGRFRRDLERFHSGGGSVVIVDGPDLGLPAVSIDDRTAAAVLGRRLAELGHQRFGVLAGPGDFRPGADRAEGFIEGVREAAGPAARIRAVTSAYTRDGGAAGVQQLVVDGRPLVDCIFAVSDAMADGAWSRLVGQGITVPDHVGLAGFGDASCPGDVRASLTSVRIDLGSVGRAAVDLAIDGRQSHRQPFTGEAVLRESTRRRA